jgi:hypothetical protein
LLGDTGVGKSSIVLRFVTNSFEKYSESTIGCVRRARALRVGISGFVALIATQRAAAARPRALTPPAAPRSCPS